jgi:hypothetical protein
VHTSTIVAAAVTTAVVTVVALVATWAARRVGAWLEKLMGALVDIARLPDAVRELLDEFRGALTRLDVLEVRVDRLEGIPA